jgi:lipid-binding SYLF domain-containing protein
MSRIFVCALLLALVVPMCRLQGQDPQTAQQQSQTALQQSQTALQQSQTALQQSQTAAQQSQTAQQQSQIAQQQAQHARQAVPQSDQPTPATHDAELRDKQTERLHDSREVLKAALNEKTGIAKNLTERAKCVVVIPSVKKAAFAFGVDYGRGAMSCRLGENFDGPWSAPSMVKLGGGNFGLQIGVSAKDLVLLILNERGVNSLLRTKSRVGGDAALAAGPFGRTLDASTDLGMRAQMLAYSRTGGAFAGVSINGGTLRPDNPGNDALYGRELTAKEIVRSGEVPVPAAGRPLIQLLDQTKDVAVAPKAGDHNK